MKIGVGLPATIPNAPAEVILEWASKAERAGFSTLGIIDRIVYPGCDPLITLAVSAGATKKIGLMTTILIVPVRQGVVLAKEIATLDRLSGGRLTVGVGLTSRLDDYSSTQLSKFETRGGQLTRQLRLMKKIWSGERVSDSVGPIGPVPAQKGGPAILIGGGKPNALSRIGKVGDGYISGGGVDSKTAAANYKIAENSWMANNREGKPKMVCCLYYALGQNSFERGSPFIKDYYGVTPQYAEYLVKMILTDKDKILQAVDAYSAIGADELILWPTIPEIEQLDLLSEVLAGQLH